MKKFLFLVLLPLLSFGQHTEFQFTKDTITDYIVVKCEGKTAAELYSKTLNWINVTYKNPKEVIKSQIENQFIRIEANTDFIILLEYKSGLKDYAGKYEIEIYFKDGKIKFDVVNVSMYYPPTLSKQGEYVTLNVSSPKNYLEVNGEFKKVYNSWPRIFCKTFNSISSDLSNFIQKEKVDVKEDKW